MAYYFAKWLDLRFSATFELTRSALKEAGFGIITEIGTTDTLA